MFDLTGVSLVSYMLRIVKDVVSRNPRFRRALGDVSIISGNRISFGNVQVLIRDVVTSPHRSSFDYFISTLTGRAVLTKVGDKDGLFIEWVTETDKSMQTPAAGVYYFNVDSVDEGTGDVQLTMETYRWFQGRVDNAQGTKIAFRDGIDATTLTFTDPTTNTAPSIQVAPSYVFLLSTVGGLVIKDTQGQTLLPMIDYWVQVRQQVPVIQSTIFGRQTFIVPDGFSNIQVINQDDYVLRANLDYIFIASNIVELSSWTPQGNTISVVGDVKLDPSVPANLIASENVIALQLAAGETLTPGAAFVSTQAADNIAAQVTENGVLTLPMPLPPGGWCRYDVRVRTGQSTIMAKKNAVNNHILPGLRIAIGDQVVEDDQCAIIVSPFVTETYRVYGDKPPVNFTIDVKANDPTTADEIAKMLWQEILWKRVDNMSSDGLTIFDVGESFAAGVRDESGTAPSYTVSIPVSAAADWRIFEPLVTRITSFNVTTEATLSVFRGSLRAHPRFNCLQVTGFLPDYR